MMLLSSRPECRYDPTLANWRSFDCNYNWSYIADDDFEWDEAKRLANVEKHDIDFLRAEALFDGRIVLTEGSSYAFADRFLT